MKFDPLLTTFVFLYLKSSNAFNACNTTPKSPIRLCMEIGKDGLLQGRMVTCKNNDCNDPERYPCEVQSTDQPQRTEENMTKEKIEHTLQVSQYALLTHTTTPPNEEANSSWTTDQSKIKSDLQKPNFFAHDLSDATSAPGNSELAEIRQIPNEIFTSDLPINGTIGLEQEQSSGTNVWIIQNLQQPCNTTKKYPGPLCNEYFTCVLTPKEEYILQTCPNNLVFDEETEECRLEDIFNCNKSREAPTFSGSSSSTESILVDSNNTNGFKLNKESAEGDTTTTLSISNLSTESTTDGAITLNSSDLVTDLTAISTSTSSNFNLFNPIINGGSVIFTAITTLLIIISSFILIDFIF